MTSELVSCLGVVCPVSGRSDPISGFLASPHHQPVQPETVRVACGRMSFPVVLLESRVPGDRAELALEPALGLRPPALFPSENALST